jgi:hypothetical protein
VLIDDAADQLWLSGLSCGDGKCATAAVAVLGELGFVIPDSPIRRRAPLADYAEMHFLNQRLIASRPLDQPVPVTPPGRTFVSGRRLVCRMEFDKGRTTPDDLRSLWRLATEPHGWLGRPVALTLYDRTSESQSSGYAGCQLIAVGESGRELWLQLPEPDNFDRVAPDRIAPYAGAFTEYQAVKEQIFRAVGVDIDPPHNRSWRQRVLGQHPMPPAVLHWP